MRTVAIIGTGIAGMSSAYMLRNAGYDVTVFEKNNYIGGHTNTVTVSEGDIDIPIDTGFIVFNNTNYPNLVKLFNKLGVKSQETDMSFAVTDPNFNLEYCGSTLNSLFCQRRNLIRPKFYKLLRQIMLFNKMAPEVLENDQFKDFSIKEYFDHRKIGNLCFTQYLVPMSVALWSAPSETIEHFPIVSLVKFFKNHGLLGFSTQFQWRTVTGGSWSYRDLLIESFKSSIQINSPVQKITRSNNGVTVTVGDKESYFDLVVMATHADQTSQILENPTDREKDLLNQFKYQENIVDLHTDKRVMPIRKNGWAAWNHAVTKKGTYVSYWMNKLQGLPGAKKDYFVSLNASEFIDSKSILKTFTYHHPIFDVHSMKAQISLPELNKSNGSVFFCGSYFGHGFHEDAISSAVNMCRVILSKEDVL